MKFYKKKCKGKIKGKATIPELHPKVELIFGKGVDQDRVFALIKNRLLAVDTVETRRKWFHYLLTRYEAARATGSDDTGTLKPPRATHLYEE